MPGTRSHEANLTDLAKAVAQSSELARSTPPELAIPTCPGWSAEDLWHHLGSVHRWVTKIVLSESTERQKRSDMGIELPDFNQLPEWISSGWG
jgi:hypothetical protein